jgi:hypothetical protein
MRAITRSRVAASARESDTNTATARCRPPGSVTRPASFVARVRPPEVPLLPVLCATGVPGGSSPLIRCSPVVLPAIQPSSRRRLGADRPRPRCTAQSRAAIASGVAQFRYCTSSPAAIAASEVATLRSRTPRLRTQAVTRAGPPASRSSTSEAVQSLITRDAASNSATVRRTPPGWLSRSGL